MIIYFVIDNPPTEFGEFQFMSKGYTKKEFAIKKMKKIKKSINDDYVTQYFEIAKIQVVK